MQLVDGSEVVEHWYNGKWNNVCAFPYTAEGEKLACSVQAHLNDMREARVVQFT
jgi:hypothetical protein